MPQIDLPNLSNTQRVLNMLRDGLIGHDTRLQGLRDDVTEQQKDIDMLKTAVLTGDNSGHLSHAERLRNLETYVDGVKDAIRYWGRLIGGALLLNFLGFSAGVLVAVVKFLPVLERLAAQP